MSIGAAEQKQLVVSNK